MNVKLNGFDRFENSILRRVERAGNLFGVFFPLHTGKIRIAFGTVQAVAGLASAIFFRLGQFMADRSEKRGYKELVDRSRSHFKNGIGNIVRGSIELIPLGGALTVIFYDKVAGKRMRYIGEEKAKKLKEQEHPAILTTNPPPTNTQQSPPPYQASQQQPTTRPYQASQQQPTARPYQASQQQPTTRPYQASQQQPTARPYQASQQQPTAPPPYQASQQQPTAPPPYQASQQQFQTIAQAPPPLPLPPPYQPQYPQLPGDPVYQPGNQEHLWQQNAKSQDWQNHYLPQYKQPYVQN